MVLTADSDVYLAFRDEGVNRIVRHVMHQRPSLFNYGTSRVEQDLTMMCEQIVAHPNVSKFVTVLEAIPLISPDIGLGDSPPIKLGLDFCVQLTDLEIDFHPENVFNLPEEMNPPLGDQKFAIRAKVCAGVSCVPRELLETITFTPPMIGTIGVLKRASQPLARPITPLAKPLTALNPTPGAAMGLVSDYMVGPVTMLGPATMITPFPPILVFPQKMNCFCLEFFAKGKVDFSGSVGHQQLALKIEEVEIVDIQPEGLENILECYIHLIVDRVILPQVTTTASQLLFGTIDLGDVGEVSIAAATGVENNPAVEENQAKMFVDFQTLDLTVSTEPEDEFGPATRTTRARSRAGPNDMTVAISEDSFRELFNVIRDNFRYSDSNSGNFGPFTAGYEVQFSLKRGTVELRNGNEIKISELDIKWDKLEASLGFDIDEQCVGGNCIVDNPFNGCAVRLPEWCVFGGDPDIEIELNLGGILVSEISMVAKPKVYYGEGAQNRWQVFMDPTLETDLDIIDIGDTIGDLIEDKVTEKINNLFSSLGLPDWAIDAILGLFGGITGIIRDVLDFTDDLGEWFADLIGVNLGLWNLVKAVVIDYLANQTPLMQLPDPYPVIAAEGPLLEVTIPIEYLDVNVDTNEMVVEADVGDVQ